MGRTTTLKTCLKAILFIKKTKMKTKNLIFVCFVLFTMLASYASFFFINDNYLKHLTVEDGFFETVTAFSFLLASIFFTLVYFKHKKGNKFFSFKTKRNIFFLFLAIIFFVGFGEEISWGQRYLGLETPEPIAEINMQHELNLHNLKMFHALDESGHRKSFLELFLNFSRIFALFWLSFCVIIPLSLKYSNKLRKLNKRINFPVVPINIGIFFLINYIIFKLIEISHFRHLLFSSMIEIKETSFSVLFLIVSIYFYNKNKK